MNRRPNISFSMLEARAYGGEGEREKKEEEKKKRDERKKRRKINQYGIYMCMDCLYGIHVWDLCEENGFVGWKQSYLILCLSCVGKILLEMLFLCIR